MNLFENEHRTIKTRGVIFSKDQMQNFRIKRIYNSVGHSDYMDESDAEKMLDNFIQRGESCLLEVAKTEQLTIFSLITFEDIWSRNVFALMNFDYYEGFPDLISLYN